MLRKGVVGCWLLVGGDGLRLDGLRFTQAETGEKRWLSGRRVLGRWLSMGWLGAVYGCGSRPCRRWGCPGYRIACEASSHIRRGAGGYLAGVATWRSLLRVRCTGAVWICGCSVSELNSWENFSFTLALFVIRFSPSTPVIFDYCDTER